MDMDIEKVARLARLALTPEESKSLVGDLNGILAYVDQLGQVDTEHVPKTHHVVAQATSYREDCVGAVLSRQEALSNAPQSDGESFLVPKVV
jgi:aspartyl-tRNA(Asn)/glutamyl-tRNA(Gln) amidotransferase subunit C